MTSGLPVPATLFPHSVFRDNQCIPASATISVTPVCAATNTFRLRNYFRNSVRAATNTFRLRDHFRNSAHKFSCSSEIIQHQLHTLFPNLLPYQHIPRTAVINHTLPHPFLHHYPLSDYFHPNLHSISFTRHAIFSPPPGPEAFSAQNDTSPEEISRTRCISYPKRHRSRGKQTD